MFGLRFNLTVNLIHLGHFQKAQARLEDLRDRATLLANELDLVRVVWLDSRVAAGLGRIEEAELNLTQVRHEFHVRGLVYDEALVALEIARLLLGQGRTAKTRELALEVEPVLRSLGVEDEARRAVSLFWEAARREQATLELLERAIEALRCSNPGVRA
jgi:hypothetical protein